MFVRGLSFTGLIILLCLFNCESQEPTNTSRGVGKTVLSTKVKKAKKSATLDDSYIVNLKRELKVGDKVVKRIHRINRIHKDKIKTLKSKKKYNAKNRKIVNLEKETELKRVLGSSLYIQYNNFNLKWKKGVK